MAELLGELLIAALNDPEALDVKRLQALTNLCRVLLEAVGVPKNAPFVHADRAEPPATADHLLRVHPALASDIAALIDAENPTAPDPELPTPNTPLSEPGSAHNPRRVPAKRVAVS